MTVRSKLFATKAHFRPLKTKDDVNVGKEKEIGKAPVNRSTDEYVPTLKEIVNHPGKLGIHPGTVGIVVIDVDPKKGGQLPSLIDEVEKLYGTPIRQIDTPGIGNNKFPGVHMLYKKADGPVNRTQWEHGDIRADTGYGAMHDEALWLEAIELAPREKAIDIDLLPNAKADGLLKGAHAKEEIIAVLKTVEEGRHPTMVSAACKLHSMDCLSDKVIDELHTIWLKQGKPDRAVNDEFPSIIRFAKKN